MWASHRAASLLRTSRSVRSSGRSSTSNTRSITSRNITTSATGRFGGSSRAARACLRLAASPCAATRPAASSAACSGRTLATAAAAASTSAASAVPTPALQLPPRILIYHAGTGRIVWVACSKVATVLLVAFACLVVAPSVYASAEPLRVPLPFFGEPGPATGSAGRPLPEPSPPPPPPTTSTANTLPPSAAADSPSPSTSAAEDALAAPTASNRPGRLLLSAAIVAGSFVPLAFVLQSTRPFVAYVHVALPPAARRSQAALATWAARIPPATRVDITSLRALGNARQTATVAAELVESARSRMWRPAASGAASSAAAATPAAKAAATAAAPLAVPPGARRAAAPRQRSGDVEIEMHRRRLPGWQPPDAGRRRFWEAPEQARFVVTAGRNRANQDEVWASFVEQLAQPERQPTAR